MTGRLRNPAAPLALLAVLCVCSLCARAAWLGEPCRSPCPGAHDHLLIFDEDYYVGAAQAIASVRSPAGGQYVGTPRGVDPNSEHPQLAKAVIAGSIELFGDGPFAWRFGSLLIGTVAIVGMFALARAAGAEPWPALGAAALMAADNLLIVHGRIATLDIYAVTAMIWAAVLYLRRRPLGAGALIGVGAAAKLVAPYVLLVLVVLEGASFVRRRPARLRPVLRAASGSLAKCAAAASVVFVTLLALLDRWVPPYDATAGRRLAAGPFHHLAHMLSYAAHQTSPHGPRGIASYPWAWLGDYKPIVYLNINPARSTAGLHDVRPAAHFLGMISPPILLAAVVALGFAACSALRGARSELGSVSRFGGASRLGLAWTAGTLLPFVALSLLWQRTSYLYYMVVVMPGLYLLAADLAWRLRRRRWLVGAWLAAVLLAAVAMYPFTPVPWD